MDYIDRINSLKKKHGYSYGYLAELSGIEAGTLQKILTGTTRHPRHDTLEKLLNTYYILNDSASEATSRHTIEPPPDSHTASDKYPLQGRYTMQDLFALPADESVYKSELIDGVIYDMSAPTLKHNFIANSIRDCFFRFITEQNGNCLPVNEPGVQLDKDDSTFIQPDLAVVCDPKNKMEENSKYFVGAPDFILEVLSPSTHKHDMVRKLRKYRESKVREYWMIDPEKEVVITYVFDSEDSPMIWNFNDIIPVYIYDNKMTIDFNIIRKWVNNFF